MNNVPEGQQLFLVPLKQKQKKWKCLYRSKRIKEPIKIIYMRCMYAHRKKRQLLNEHVRQFLKLPLSRDMLYYKWKASAHNTQSNSIDSCHLGFIKHCCNQ